MDVTGLKTVSQTDETDANLGPAPESAVQSEPLPSDPDKVPLVLEEYDFSHKRRGKCVLFNNRYFDESTGQKERDGTDLDAQRMQDAFYQLGFDVDRVDNAGWLEYTQIMRSTAEEDHSDADCFVCVILSHGRSGNIYARDGMVSIDSLTKFFKGDVCKSLAGKPKLFFLQACRGSKFDHGVTLEQGEDDVDASPAATIIRRIPAEADFMIAYSVVPGYFSWRNNIDGSWFIQALYRVLQTHGDSMELSHMMVLVNKIVAYDFASCTDYEWTDNMKQVPCIESMLTKLVHFRPKVVG